MKKINNYYVFLMLFFAIPLLNAQNNTKKVDSKINKVIVFSEGAQVSRLAKTTFSNGKTELVFYGISRNIDKQSLQVKGIGNFTILSVIHQNNFINTQKNREEIEKLQLEKRTLSEKRNSENNILTILQNEENILAKNQIIGGSSNGLKATDLKEAIDFHRQRLMELLKQKTEISLKIITIDSSIVKLDKQLKSLNQSDENATSDVIVTVSSNSNIAEATFEINYFVLNAGWYSNYDLRVEDISNPINLLFKANIFQSSGEDWKDVKLSISSGNPTESGILPTLNPWYLNPNYSNYKSSTQLYGQLIGNTVSGIVSDEFGALPGATVIVKGTTIGTNTDFDGKYSIKVPNNNSILEFSYIGKEKVFVNATSSVINVDLTSNLQAEEVVIVGYSSKRKSKKPENEDYSSLDLETTVNYQPTTISYDIDMPYTVLSDSKIYTAEIKKFNLPTDYQYVSVPKLDESAYLIAKIVDWQDLNLFDGEVNLFFEGAYLGKSLLDLKNASDTLSISLGKDKGIFVSRKQLKDFKAKQFLSNYKTESKGYEIVVKNNKSYPINITILDQFPISQNKEITVNEEEYSAGTIDKDSKTITWKLNLLAKEEKRLNLKFKVKSPKNMGLNWE